MIDYLDSLNSSRSLQTSSVISFIISLCLILQMCKDFISKCLRAQLNEALDHVFSPLYPAAKESSPANMLEIKLYPPYSILTRKINITHSTPSPHHYTPTQPKHFSS